MNVFVVNKNKYQQGLAIVISSLIKFFKNNM